MKDDKSNMKWKSVAEQVTYWDEDVEMEEEKKNED